MTSSSVFASEDIAELVRLFDPFRREDPSQSRLIRNSSGQHLRVFSVVVADLRALLEDPQSETPISPFQLSDLLDVDPAAIGALLREADVPIYLSTSRELIPKSLAERLRAQLASLANEGLVSLQKYSADAAITPESLSVLTEEDAKQWYRVPATAVNAQDDLICTESYRDAIYEQLLTAVVEADAEPSKANLSELEILENCPVEVIRALAHDLCARPVHQLAIESGQVWYTPADFAKAEERKRREALESRADVLMSDIKTRGFCILGEMDEDVDLLEAILQQRWPGELHAFTAQGEQAARADTPAQTKCIYLLQPKTLADLQTYFRAEVARKLQKSWASGQKILDARQLVSQLELSKSHPLHSISSQILQDKSYTRAIEGAAQDRITEFQEEDALKFNRLVEDWILIPVRLHIVGLEMINENALRERLNEYTCKHLQQDLKTLTSDLRQLSLLYGSREKDYLKFEETALATTTLTNLHLLALKLMKKLKLDAPSESRLRDAKRQILRRTLNAMRAPDTRGSDVLQHALWILLAEQSKGVFVSAGKDTSRMIAQYEAVGDARIAQQLKAFRDRLKAGQAGREETQEIRELAMRVVDTYVT